jgi:hypothetical protein
VVSTGAEVLAIGRDVHGSTWGIGGEELDVATGRWRLLPFAPEPFIDRYTSVEGVWTGRRLAVVASDPDPLGPQPAQQVALAYRLGASDWTTLPRPPPLAAKDYLQALAWTGQDLAAVDSAGTTALLKPGGTRWRTTSTPDFARGGYTQAGTDLLASSSGPTARVTAKLTGSSGHWSTIRSSPPFDLTYSGTAWTGRRYLQVQRACDRRPDLAVLNPRHGAWTQHRIDPSPLQCGAPFETAWAGDLLVFLQTATTSYGPVSTPQGAALDPSSGHWLTLPPGPSVANMQEHNTVWDGQELFVFGDPPNSAPTIPVAAYRPPFPLPHLRAPIPTVPATLPVCSSASLRASLHDLFGQSDVTIGGSIYLTNAGATPCRLAGTPTLTLFGPGQQPIALATTPINFTEAPGPVGSGPVALAPGVTNTAEIYLQYEDSDRPFGPPCPLGRQPATADVSFAAAPGAVPVTSGPTSDTTLGHLRACRNQFMVGPVTATATFG